MKHDRIDPLDIIMLQRTNPDITVNEIAERLDTTYHKVWSAARQNDIVIRRSSRNRKYRVRRVKSGRILTPSRQFMVLSHWLRHPDEPLASIAQQYNCTREYVSQIQAMARQAGIPPLPKLQTLNTENF
jgi:hypothetical protein